MIECKICLFHSENPGIEISEIDGVCNICKAVEKLNIEFGTGTQVGTMAWENIADSIKKSGAGKKYDCIIGVSGGTDSSFLLHIAKEFGLNPLAFHYDNTWNSAIATMNISTMLRALNIDLETHVVNNKEIDDIYRSVFEASVAELDASTDLAFAYLLRKIAKKHKIRFILEGHSFREEGITPLGRNYFDGRYIKEIHKQFGSVPLSTYPLMTFAKFVYQIIFARVKFIRPLWYLKYDKTAAKELLKSQYGWKDYGGHHLENRLTTFLHSEYLPSKFSTDMRNNVLSAMVRSGKLSKSEAREIYETSPEGAAEAKNYFMKRLNYSESEYREVMDRPMRSWQDFKTYKRRFELFRPFFALMAKKNLVTKSFYLKYCIRESNQ